jgi:hypothetical protein
VKSVHEVVNLSGLLMHNQERTTFRNQANRSWKDERVHLADLSDIDSVAISLSSGLLRLPDLVALVCVLAVAPFVKCFQRFGD